MNETTKRRASQDHSVMGLIRRYQITSDVYDEVSVVMHKYAVFDGRADRREYWYYRIFLWALNLVLWQVGSLLHMGVLAFVMIEILHLATITPSYAVLVRRLHDLGMSGYKALISLIPIAGFIVVIMWTIQEGDPNENQYGPCPESRMGAVEPLYSARELYGESQEEYGNM